MNRLETTAAGASINKAVSMLENTLVERCGFEKKPDATGNFYGTVFTYNKDGLEMIIRVATNNERTYFFQTIVQNHSVRTVFDAETVPNCLKTVKQLIFYLLGKQWIIHKVIHGSRTDINSALANSFIEIKAEAEV